jgi:hypothetical protein
MEGSGEDCLANFKHIRSGRIPRIMLLVLSTDCPAPSLRWPEYFYAAFFHFANAPSSGKATTT